MVKRRDFLRATLITAGAIFVPGCGPDNTDNPPPTTKTIDDGAAFFPQAVASGDPKPDSVILWARIEDKDVADGDVSLEVQISTKEDFSALVMLDEKAKAVKALAKYDHCAKARIAGLNPATVYYYRFLYAKGDKTFGSQTGRTKTAPATDADVAVKFAFVSCQDYIGRYYNAYVALAAEDIDFFVHLGDYIYETTGDPTFQNTDGRSIKFTDQTGAIPLGDPQAPFYAAKSLDNYRQIYRTIRSDKNLQKVHMLFPMIATWDDHEYSNDCHGAVATYFDGKKDEKDEDRRKAANQAWFEYQPVDFASQPDFAYDPKATYPNDIRIFRDFTFGQHVHLVMTDLRTYRATNLVAGDAFPGTVVMDQTAVKAAANNMIPAFASPYIDVETYQGGIYKTALTAVAMAAGFDAAKVTGKLAVNFINALANKVNPSLPAGMQIPLIDDAAQMGLEKGIAYIDMGKSSFYSSIGSRYLIVKDAFDLYAAAQYKATQGQSEDVMGGEQEDWFLAVMQASKATWKVWGNEYSLSQLAIDLSQLPLPAAFQHSFYLDAEDWDGYRNKRAELIGKLADVGGVVAITGDIHACYAGTPAADAAGKKKIVEFVGSSITSQTFVSELKAQVAGDPVLSQVPGAGMLAANIDTLLQDKSTKINPYLGFADSTKNGYAVVSASGTEFAVTMKLIPENQVTVDHSGNPDGLNAFVSTIPLRTVPGGSDLYQQIGGAWKKWDPTTQTYV